jgi:hypothetical protein
MLLEVARHAIRSFVLGLDRADEVENYSWDHQGSFSRLVDSPKSRANSVEAEPCRSSIRMNKVWKLSPFPSSALWSLQTVKELLVKVQRNVKWKGMLVLCSFRLSTCYSTSTLIPGVPFTNLSSQYPLLLNRKLFLIQSYHFQILPEQFVTLIWNSMAYIFVPEDNSGPTNL